jgi:hypothetical protein
MEMVAYALRKGGVQGLVEQKREGWVAPHISLQGLFCRDSDLATSIAQFTKLFFEISIKASMTP